MTYPRITGEWTALHDALYYPLSGYLASRNWKGHKMQSVYRRRALEIIAQIKGRKA